MKEQVRNVSTARFRLPLLGSLHLYQILTFVLINSRPVSTYRKLRRGEMKWTWSLWSRGQRILHGIMNCISTPPPRLLSSIARANRAISMKMMQWQCSAHAHSRVMWQRWWAEGSSFSCSLYWVYACSARRKSSWASIRSLYARIAYILPMARSRKRWKRQVLVTSTYISKQSR